MCLRNENVLPFAYGSMALMTEDDYDQLSYPENLDTLANPYDCFWCQ